MVVFFTIIQKVNQFLGPFLLRNGIYFRYRFSYYGGNHPIGQDLPLLDTICLLPWSQRLVSLEIYDTIIRIQQQQKQKQKPKELTIGVVASATSLSSSSSNSKPNHVEEEEEEKTKNVVLEKYLRSIIIPTESWYDVQQWQFQHRIIKWVRQQLLLIQYGNGIHHHPVVLPTPTTSTTSNDDDDDTRTNHSSSTRSSSGGVTRSKCVQLLQQSPQILSSFYYWTTSPNHPNIDHQKQYNFFSSLPTSTCIRNIFHMHTSTNDKNSNAIYTEMIRILDQDDMNDDCDHESNNRISTHHPPLSVEPPEKETKQEEQFIQIQSNHIKKNNGYIIPIRNGGMNITILPSPYNISHLSLNEIITLVGGATTLCNHWNAFCETTNLYTLWTQEYITILGQYIQNRIQTHYHLYGGSSGRTIILDIGAGDGILAQALRSYFDQQRQHQQQTKFQTGTNLSSPSTQYQHRNNPSKKNGFHRNRTVIRQTNDMTTTPPLPLPPNTAADTMIPTIIAIDNKSWSIPERAPIERINVQMALNKYVARQNDPRSPHLTSDQQQEQSKQHHQQQQVIVLCSWMPMGVDWTHLFRQYKVDEYILIGECDDGQCGDNWLTWGNIHYAQDDPLQPAPPPSPSPSKELQIEKNGSNNNNHHHNNGNVSSPIHNNSNNFTKNNINPIMQRQQPQQYNQQQDIHDNYSRITSPGSAATTMIPPYQLDGYVRRDLDELSPYQFSRYDYAVSKAGRTVSFRKAVATTITATT